MKYAVRLEFIGHKWIQVEAETYKEAEDAALNIGVNLDAAEFRDDTEVSVYDSVEDEA